MRSIHKARYTPAEIESYRHLVFDNIIQGMRMLLDARENMDYTVAPLNSPYVEIIQAARSLRDGEAFPIAFYEALTSLWNDSSVQAVWERRNENGLPN
jgi:guanine nucleotide-binding protein subunit alpha, other